MDDRHQRLREIAERELISSAHNMEHVLRVYNLCLHLAENDPDIDVDVLKSSALLHDIARDWEDEDDTGTIDHALLGAEMAEKVLIDLGYPEDKIERIKHCIRAHRFRSSCRPQTKEAMILFDADKLDVIGAIGIARSFMIAGQYGEKMYSDVPIDDYVKDNLVDGKPDGRIKDISKHAPNIEFETKLRHVPNRLYLLKAKEIAKHKMEFMTRFYEVLGREIRGKV